MTETKYSQIKAEGRIRSFNNLGRDREGKIAIIRKELLHLLQGEIAGADVMSFDLVQNYPLFP